MPLLYWKISWIHVFWVLTNWVFTVRSSTRCACYRMFLKLRPAIEHWEDYHLLPHLCWHLVFEVRSFLKYGPTTRAFNPLHFCLWRQTLKKKRHFTDALLMPVKLSQLPLDFWKGATFRDQEFPCVHWFRWRKFWVHVVNCDLTNIRDSTYIYHVLQVCYVSWNKMLRS